MRFILPHRRAEARAYLDSLPADEMFTLTVAPYTKPLPDNLRARIHCAIRDLANFCGYSESQFKYAIVKEEWYPREIKVWRGAQRSVPVDTMKLTPAQAREVEAHLFSLAAEIGAPMSDPHQV